MEKIRIHAPFLAAGYYLDSRGSFATTDNPSRGLSAGFRKVGDKRTLRANAYHCRWRALEFASTPQTEEPMQTKQNSKWIKRATFGLVIFSTLACSLFGFDMTGTSGQTVEVTRIVRETVVVPGSDTVITVAPVIVEITHEVEVTRQVEVTRVVTAVPLSPPIDLEGVWLNPVTHSVTTITWTGDRFKVVSVVDLDDGDVYPVTASNWDGSIIQWGYYVPSTDYNVVFTMTSLVGDNLNCDWYNDHGGSGTRTLQRQ